MNEGDGISPQSDVHGPLGARVGTLERGQRKLEIAMAKVKAEASWNRAVTLLILAAVVAFGVTGLAVR